MGKPLTQLLGHLGGFFPIGQPLLLSHSLPQCRNLGIMLSLEDQNRCVPHPFLPPSLVIQEIANSYIVHLTQFLQTHLPYNSSMEALQHPWFLFYVVILILGIESQGLDLYEKERKMLVKGETSG